jgi:two-component system sensor histidine kinase/response regulator
MSILVVDDTPANLRLLHRLLGAEGYRVRLATNGELALRSVREESPDLILLDVVMPGMDGFAVCRALKEQEASREIPIIFISALSETDRKLEAFAVGGVDYVTKPFQSAEVLARVRTHLELLQHRRALLALNERLLASNRELDRFAHVVAHDLKAPLQGISGYAELLLLTDPSLSPTARERLEHIQGSTTRMGELIDRLLRYAKLSSAPPALAPVDLGALAAGICAELQPAIEACGARVDLGELPWVMADATLLEQVFRNLLGNALKYHQPDRPPVVEICAHRQGERVAISVRDEGIGFDSADEDVVFGLFQRLPAHRDIEGTGVGLAVCKKIVEQHGGRIAATSALGHGATFTFTLAPGDPPASSSGARDDV